MSWLISATAAVVQQVAFMTVSQAERLLQASLDNHPADALVCVVALQGDFVAPSLPGYPATTGHVGHLVFDGETGNLLVETGEGLGAT